MNPEIKTILTILGMVVLVLAIAYIPFFIDCLLYIMTLWLGWFFYRLILSLHGGPEPEYPLPDFIVNAYGRIKK
jgi:hypothetical protein